MMPLEYHVPCLVMEDFIVSMPKIVFLLPSQWLIFFGSGCFHHLIGNTLIYKVQRLTICAVRRKVVMCPQMNACPRHPRSCGMNVNYVSIAQNNTNRCQMTYPTIQSRFPWGHTTHKSGKWVDLIHSLEFQTPTSQWSPWAAMRWIEVDNEAISHRDS